MPVIIIDTFKEKKRDYAELLIQFRSRNCFCSLTYANDFFEVTGHSKGDWIARAG